MVVNLSRADLEKAIKKYVKDEVLGYTVGNNIEMIVTQGKSATAKVELVEKVEVEVNKTEQA